MLSIPGSKRLLKQLEFLKEIDQLKTVLRQSKIMDGSREENTAEHSWHFAMAVLILSEHSSQPIDISKTLKMALIHDVVEVYAGDTFVYDDKAREQKSDIEKKAAIKIYSLLPEDIGEDLHNLWLEYEEQITPESKFALAVDRILPILCNYQTNGHSWKKHGIKKAQVLEKNRPWKEAAPELHNFITTLLDQAQLQGYLI